MQYKQFLNNEYRPATGNDEAAELYDLSALYEMDDNEYVAQILTIFLRDTSNELRLMKEAVVSKRINVVHSGAHRLKSSCSIIKANGLLVLLEHIENISRDGNYTGGLAETVEKAGFEYDKIQGPLMAILKNLA